MGLDMYLTKKIYIGANCDHSKITGTINIKDDGKKIKINLNKVSYIEEACAYWRKANCIHKWFVDNVQGGIDNCVDYYVEPEKLEQLLSICEQIKENPKKAAELLPTQEGFFFGSQEYDEYYMQNINYTIEQLKEALKDKDGDFHYSSSW